MQDVVQMSQVHGSNVVFITSKNAGTKIPDCDGLITNDPKLTLCVRVADCLPIFIFDPVTGTKALVHAGWRGLEKEIIKSAVNQFNSKSVDQLLVYVGPHICSKHYEVKNDVASKFSKYRQALTFKGATLKGRRTFLDLGNIAKTQLINSGVLPKNIKIDKTCTFEDKKLFSFRKNGTKNRNLYYF